MQFFGYKLDEGLRLGFFEVHRLWNIQDELKARDLEYQSVILDLPHCNEERRQQVWTWLKSRQPRRLSSSNDSKLNLEDQQRLKEMMQEAGLDG